MSETTEQFDLGLEVGSQSRAIGLPEVLDHIRSRAASERQKGYEFERLMKALFRVDPLYKERFSDVWLWSEWGPLNGYDRIDTGIDIVAQQHNGEHCAIQCKCYAFDTKLTKPHLDSFIADSKIKGFTKLGVVNTGGWNENARKIINQLGDDCFVIDYAKLANLPIKWSDLNYQQPEQLTYQIERFDLKRHQQEAFDAVIDGFQESDRGKLIMACGTGKTFTALRIAEQVAGCGGRVLYLVPSIGLFAQAMREWAEQQEVPHRYIGICSDTSAGKKSEDAPIQELEIPVTTDTSKITKALQTTDPTALTVVFCTYHSLPRVADAQAAGAPEFDLVLCDEAHRTTGIDRPDDKISPFVLVHDSFRIRANKRLYMTATPRLYAPNVKARAADHHADLFSMDDPATYGPEFHRLTFSKAVDMKILADYKVAIFTVYEPDQVQALQGAIDKGGKEINITDATKMVGCWRALQNPEGKPDGDATIKPLTRVIAFNNRIIDSKRLEAHWNDVIDNAIERMPKDKLPTNFECETRHVDGQHNAFDRKNQIEWLKGSSEGVCRILSNARCLSEGIDVPALDAVIFMTPRSSYVDIVQAVGRVMRKPEGKEYGYIILPVAIPPGTDPADALDNNERFASVWNVLNALRSHDERFNNEINKIDLNKNQTKRIIFTPPDGETTPTEGGIQQWIDYPWAEIPADALYAKIVDRCGERGYWESWAKDVADIFNRVVLRIESLLDNPDNDTLHEWFENFHDELIKTINVSITRGNAIDMMAQHVLTRPVFEALFESYDFAAGNPVSVALDSLWNVLGEFGLEEETRDLKGFYESVQTRAQGIDNSEGRQTVLAELYQKFFTTATKKDADRLGIVYTPVEVVDFILHSAADVLQEEFGRSLSDEGVHIIDPFVGAGTFLARLLQSDLIEDADLERKYSEELHANEIVLLAYYIAAVNIEEVFRGRRGADKGYAPFEGIVLTDTFNLNKEGEPPTLFPKEWLPDNNERAERQQELPIQVIVGNPPWSAGQKSSADDNPNVRYPELEERVRETYVARSKAKLKKGLYDTYKMAIRWASDRIGEQGVIAFVTNGSWIDGNVDSGIRACLVEEFSSVYVLNLRGNARTSGEQRRAEGDNIFGQGSRAPVAITILVKNPNAAHDGCRILYRDIGDYLKQEEKLGALREAVSISGVSDWQEITPDKHYDWIRQRDPAFEKFTPLGSEDAKKGVADDTIFRVYSRGLATSRDPYIYNFSRDACAENGRRMTEDYLAAVEKMVQQQLLVLDEHPDMRRQFDRVVKEAIRTQPELTEAEAICAQLLVFSRHRDLEEQFDRAAEEASRSHSSHLRWDLVLRNNLKRQKRTEYDEGYIRKAAYRPFVATNCYADYTLINSKYLVDRIFPNSSSENQVICVPNIGGQSAFSVLMTDMMPDLHFNETSQCFPRYCYQPPPSTPAEADTTETLEGIEPDSNRIDNITHTALDTFLYHYNDSTITKDMIFDYVYGLLHAPRYREQFANNLYKEMPCIPFAPDFHAFAEAGKELAELHLGYETCKRYPLEVIFAGDGDAQPHHFRLTEKPMRLEDDKTTLIINDHVRLSGIPAEVHRSVVNGRTPLEWFIDRYYIKQDRDSGIVNDPNGWFENPLDLVTAIKRIVYVNVESTRIIDRLPSHE